MILFDQTPSTILGLPAGTYNIPWENKNNSTTINTFVVLTEWHSEDDLIKAFREKFINEVNRFDKIQLGILHKEYSFILDKKTKDGF